MNLEEKYKELCQIPSDINEHLPVIREYAEKCESWVEFGVRYGDSTIAALAGKPKKMLSVDINEIFDWRKWQKEVEKDTEFTFLKANDLEIEIEPCDGILIDSLHNYNQLKKELLLHGNKAKKYILFHDTTSFEWHGESYNGKPELGIWIAIEDFLKSNPHWKIKERFTHNNGLTVLFRS